MPAPLLMTPNADTEPGPKTQGLTPRSKPARDVYMVRTAAFIQPTSHLVTRAWLANGELTIFRGSASPSALP